MRRTRTWSMYVFPVIILLLTLSSAFLSYTSVRASTNTLGGQAAFWRDGLQTTNLVVNGSFESGSLSSWEPEGSISASSGAGYNGSYGAQMNGSGRITQLVNTSAGQKYTVSGWLRINKQISAASWGGVRIQITDANWKELARSSSYSSANSQWIAINFTFTAASAQSRIAFENFSGGGQYDAVFDDAVISLSGSATPTATRTPTATPTATSMPTATAGAVLGSLIKNGDFEAGNLSSWEDFGGISVANSAAFAGNYGARINENGRIDQSFATVSGQSYSVIAKLRLEQQLVNPSWGGLAFLITNSSWQTIATSPYYTKNNAALNQWIDISFSFKANSSLSRISFQNFSDGKFVGSIDNVRITAASVATSTPTATAASIPTATPTTATQPTATRLPTSGNLLESFEGSQSAWLVSSWLSGSGKLQSSTTNAADGQTSVLLSTNASPSRAQLQVSFSDSATSHSWEERPGSWNWQRAMVYLPSSSVNQLQDDQYFTLAGLYPSIGGAYGWSLRVKANGQLYVYSYTANGSPTEFPAYASLPLDRWVSLELGLHTQAGPGVKRSFAFLLDGDFYGWYRQGNMGSENYNRAAFGILETNTSVNLQVYIDAWQKMTSDPFPSGPDTRDSSAVQTHDFRNQSGKSVQYDWSTWELQPKLHAQYGLYSAVDRIQAGHNIDRMPELRNGWAEIEIDWPNGTPATRQPQGYFGPMVGFRKEINREQNLEIIPIGNGNGTVDLALEAWVGSPVILARWPIPTASIGSTSIPEPGDIIRVRWEEVSASNIDVRASYYDASAGTWYTDIIKGSYNMTAISDGSATVNYMDGYHL